MSEWIEARLYEPWQLHWVYEIADAHGCESIHHFSEPWNKYGRVVRIKASEAALRSLTRMIASSKGCVVVPWDAAPDERLFGSDWPAVAQLFEAASRLSLTAGSAWRDKKLVHCMLNSLGYSVGDEIGFARRFAWDRLRIWVHDWSWKIAPLGRGNCIYGCHRESWT